jgi:hypothetical protein
VPSLTIINQSIKERTGILNEADDFGIWSRVQVAIWVFFFLVLLLKNRRWYPCYSKSQETGRREMEMRAAAGYLVGGVPGGGGLGLHRAPGGRAPGREVGAQQQERGEGERRGRSGPGGGGRRIDRLIGFPDRDGFVVVVGGGGGGGGSPPCLGFLRGRDPGLLGFGWGGQATLDRGNPVSSSFSTRTKITKENIVQMFVCKISQTLYYILCVWIYVVYE